MSTTVVLKNGKVREVEDDNFNGSSLGLRTLMRKNTYVGMGFDFDNQWTISEGTSFPYNINQCSPPTILSCVSSSTVTKITGTAPSDGIIYVFAGDKMYEGKIVGGIWEVIANVPLSMGTIVKASADTENKMPSIFATYKVTKEESELEKCATPTITYDRGHLVFACATPGSKFISKVMAKDVKESTEAELKLSMEYTITIYATAEGFADSDAVTATLHFGDANMKAEGIIVADTKDLRGDMNQDGVVNVADITYIVKTIMETGH